MTKILEILDQFDPEQLMQDAEDSIDGEFYTVETLKDKIMLEAENEASLLDDKWCLKGKFIHRLKENGTPYREWSYVLAD